jgi:ribosomal protein S18 acetylase RimI-like enzyme
MAVANEGLELRTLDKVPLERLHAAYLRAFSDYSVQVDMPLWRFRAMARRRGFRPELSVGTFAGDELVGFIMNAVRDWQGTRTGYDLCTGVVPEWRKRGVTTTAFPEALRLLRGDGVRQHLLEVIQANAPAVDLYTKQGFERTRSFTCFATAREKMVPSRKGGVDVAPVDIHSLDWERLRSFWDHEPSWQNSIDSVTAVPETMEAVAARVDGRVVGYGIVERATGDVPQLAVDPGHRGRGVGGAILAALVARTASQRVAVINVDDRDEAGLGFVGRAGLEVLARQYEMVKGL